MSNFNKMAEEFLAQERIAVAGVSRSEEESANYIYKKLRDEGYQVFPINPNAGEVEGDTCYPNVSSIPEGVDGVIIITRPELTEKIADDCIKHGIPRVWMHNNTFLPSSVSQSAVQKCRENDIMVIDGGCPMMVLEFGHKCMKWMLGVMGRLPK